MEQGNPLISVIIPVYNRQEYIEECIHSVCDQTHQNFEIIIIDDGSTDDTFNICQRLADRDPRIKLLTGDHAGVSAARNKGVDSAVGDFVFFIDSDDVIHPYLLKTLVEAMIETGADIGGTIVQNIQCTIWDKLEKHIKDSLFPGETTYQDHETTVYAVFHETTPLGNIGGVMIRRELIGATRFRTDLTIGEDFYFIYENLIKGAGSVFLKQRWYYCRIHKHNTSNSFGFDGFWTRFLRRKLVWESELRMGRPENADMQKMNISGLYHKFLLKGRMTKQERMKMCSVMRRYKKELMTPYSVIGKIKFLLAVYAPWIFLLYQKVQGYKQTKTIWD